MIEQNTIDLIMKDIKPSYSPDKCEFNHDDSDILESVEIRGLTTKLYTLFLFKDHCYSFLFDEFLPYYRVSKSNSGGQVVIAEYYKSDVDNGNIIRSGCSAGESEKADKTKNIEPPIYHYVGYDEDISTKACTCTCGKFIKIGDIRFAAFFMESGGYKPEHARTRWYCSKECIPSVYEPRKKRNHIVEHVPPAEKLNRLWKVRNSLIGRENVESIRMRLDRYDVEINEILNAHPELRYIVTTGQP